MILPTTPMLPAFLGRQMQIAFVVKDLDEALRFWTEAMNVGPFVVIEGAMDDRQIGRAHV